MALRKIDELIESVTNSDQKSQFDKQDEQILKSNLHLYPVNIEVFNFAVYQELLALTKTAILIEQPKLSSKQKKKFAGYNAYKLAILFGSADKAIDYLKLYEKTFPDAKKIVHDACLFELSSNKEWNVQLWRDIVSYNKVTGPENLLMRLIPFAAAIEKYIQENSDLLKNNLRQELEAEYRKRLSDEFDESSHLDEKKIAAQLLMKHKLIE